MARGTLRVYLGAAPGVGKTYAMLDEGWRRQQRGADVVVGFVECHGRPKTLAQLRDLEVVPRQRLQYRGAVFEEMDLDAVLARHPRVALVDELAHTNVPGTRHPKRWQDIEELLDAGIDVISTVNIQHLESLNDVVETITGITQRETVPDAWVRQADQVELVDMSPEALRRRMAHGNIYPPEKVDAALGNYFRPGNLAALRELALLWVADRVEEYLDRYQERHGIAAAWETRERVVVAITGVAGGDAAIRRAARMAGRAGGELLGLHVVASDGLAVRAGPELEGQRALLGELGGQYREVVGDDIADALVDFARAEKATQLVLGASRRSRLFELSRGSVISRVLRQAQGIDVHVISSAPGRGRHDHGDGQGLARLPRRGAPLSTRRLAVAAAGAAVGLPLLIAVLAPHRDDIDLATVALVMLVAVVAVAAAGGLVIGVPAALAASLLLNWFFVAPYRTLTISQPENVVSVVVFVAVAIVVSLLVDRAARQARQARVARAEAEALAHTSASLVGHADPLPEVLDQLRTTFRLDAVALLVPEGGTGRWHVEAAAGEPVPADPNDGVAVDVPGEARVVLVGRQLPPDVQRVLTAFTRQLAVALENRRLQREVDEAAALRRANELRTALLQAVSHDLRTPLSSIKASVTSLLQSDITWDDADRKEFLATIDAEADRLNRVVGNLLDMSRLQAGVVQPVARSVYLEDVVANALANVPHATAAVRVAVPETVPAVVADPALLERALANVLANAIAWSPAGVPVRVEAAPLAYDGHHRVHLRVIDQGPGISPALREQVFAPFQRLGDARNGGGGPTAGVGLGLAVARGFVTAMAGELTLDDTPGGGLTVTIDLPQADSR